MARENANVGFSEFPWEGFVRPGSASFWLCLALRCKPQHAGGQIAAGSAVPACQGTRAGHHRGHGAARGKGAALVPPSHHPGVCPAGSVLPTLVCSFPHLTWSDNLHPAFLLHPDLGEKVGKIYPLVLRTSLGEKMLSCLFSVVLTRP